MQVFEGFEECEAIDVIYNNTIIASYKKKNTGVKLKVEINGKDGLKDGDRVYITIDYRQRYTWNNLDLDYNTPHPCPGEWVDKYGEIVEGVGNPSTSLIDYEYPLTIVYESQSDYTYGHWKDKNNDQVAFFGYQAVDTRQELEEVTTIYFVDGFDLDGNPFCSISDYIEKYIDVDYGYDFEWWYSDQYGTPLGGATTEIKVYEWIEGGFNGWWEQETIVVQGNKTPNTVQCAASCDEDCIELWDTTETYRMCLCEHTGDPQKDLVFPNLDAESWPMFE